MRNLLGIVLGAFFLFSALGESTLTPAQRNYLQASRAERRRMMGDAAARAELAKGTEMEVGGVFNFRDLGGKRGLGGRPVRSRLLYRSARFDEVTDEGRRQLARDLHIRTDLDLRSAKETRHLNGHSPLGTNVTWRLVSLRAYADVDSESGRKAMRSALQEIFATKNWPLAFHCKTGKDRTGTLAFVLLALLGVDEEVICLDWERTAFYVPELSRMDHPTRYDRMLGYFMSLPGTNLTAKVEGYVRSLGFSDANINAFREALLAPSSFASSLSEKPLKFANGTVGTYECPVAAGDFGRDAFAWLEVRSRKTGKCVLRIGEQCDSDGTVIVKPKGSIRGCEVTCPVGENWTRVPLIPDKRNTTGKNGIAIAIKLPAEVGTIMPFRYVQKVSGPDDLEMRRVFVHWPMEHKVKCPVDDVALRELWDFCQYAIVATSFAGIMVDGDRERIPYEGDIYINMLGQLYGVDGDPELARRSIRHVLKYPTWPTEWKQHAIMCVWEDWHFTGSTALAEECYDQLKREKLMMDRARPDGLLPSDKYDIVDWPVSERDGYQMETSCNAVVNAFHYRNLREMADLARELGKTADVQVFDKRAAMVLNRFNELFYDRGRGLYVDGEGTSHASLHVNVAALDFGLVPKERQKTVVDFISNRGMACSPYFAQYYLEALCKYGRRDVAKRLMRSRGERSWLGMVDQGATMTMEAWSIAVKPNQDWNHAWGAAPLNIIARYF